MEKKNTHIAYGLITGVISVVVSLIIYMTGIAFKPGMQYVAEIPLLAGIIMNAIAFSKANDGFVTFGNVFGSGFKMAMIVSLVMIVWSIISIFVFPEMKVKAMEVARTEMAKNPKVTDDQIEMSINLMKKYWNAFMIAGIVFSTLLYGAIFALIGGLVAKKKGAMPMADNF